MVEEAGRVDVYQGGYNLLWTSPERELLPFLKRNDIGFIPYAVLAQGLLTGTGIEHLEQNHEGFRHKMLLYGEDLKPAVLKILKELTRACGEAGISVEQAVARYTLERSAADSLLLGCRNRAQAEANFAPFGEDISGGLRAVMDRIAEEFSPLAPAAPNLFNHKS
jgi:aryl-alcohol dehydrogenase-like predicted oxidoreductase